MISFSIQSMVSHNSSVQRLFPDLTCCGYPAQPQIHQRQTWFIFHYSTITLLNSNFKWFINRFDESFEIVWWLFTKLILRDGRTSLSRHSYVKLGRISLEQMEVNLWWNHILYWFSVESWMLRNNIEIKSQTNFF